MRWKSDHFHVMVPESCDNLWSRMNKTIIQKQNRWFACEFRIYSEPLNEQDQDNCYILLKNVSVRYPFCLCSSAMSTPARNPSIFSVLMRLSLTCEETMNGVKDSPAADTQHITDICLRLQYTVMGRLIGHWDRNDHFSRSLIFPFRNAYLVEVKY
jgi:hypothetical protein